MVNLPRAVNGFSTGHPPSLVNGTVRFFNRWQTVSAVLRKKIDAGAGIPPSIMQLQHFWLQLQACTQDWAADTYGIRPEVSLASRRVVNGQEAQQKLEAESGFYYSAATSPGLAGIALDAAGSIRNAAVRMNQDIESLGDASPLFLKLLAEQAGLELCHQVTADLFDAEEGASSAPDPSGAAGRFETSSRYLLLEYRLQMDDEVSSVWFAYFFEFIQQYVISSQRAASDRKGQGRHQSQRSLNNSILASTTMLDAVLDRLSLTIGECAKLEVGTVLPLAGADGGRLSLSADTINGCVDIGTGELGVWKRQRALKLKTPISKTFAQEIVDS
ncbi:FliM/FliN family flagellar motor C-terminal domain-containing protein [Hyphomonas adhaerens]|nr:FliM/FliN family flagellar motor C-terminal domain-containing protein [Hyphomonas adhaerens]